MTVDADVKNLNRKAAPAVALRAMAGKKAAKGRKEDFG
jgi:hypothetical protein